MKRAKRWPDWLEDIWAKSGQKVAGGKAPGESLAEHTWRVLRHLRALAERHSAWEHCGQMPDGSSFWPAIFWACFFHDWGKAASGFQEMLRGRRRWLHRHEVLSVAFLDWIASVCTPAQMQGIAAAILTHHLDEDETKGLYSLTPDEGSDDVRDLVSQLNGDTVVGLWKWFAEVLADWIEELGFDKLGVTWPQPPAGPPSSLDEFREAATESVRKRLTDFRKLLWKLDFGQADQWKIPGVLLRGALIECDHGASAYLRAPELLRFPEAGIAGRFDRLYEHQKQVARVTGSCILIAPTGSGKTEAALLWAEKQHRDAGVRKIHYTLPYQASMNAMHERLEKEFPSAVGLVHSRSALAVYRRLMQQGYDEADAAKAAKLADALARLRSNPVQVSSPYQMLKVAYRLKGYEAMMCDLAGSAFVFDEIHAYDAGRLAMILELCAFLREKLRSTFLVMSATLPSHVRLRISEVLGEAPVIRADEELFRSFSRHSLYMLDGDILSEDVLSAIVREFRAGRSVLVTCNTVERAQRAYRCIKTLLEPGDGPSTLLLVHSRFNGADRIDKEKMILEATGVGSGRRRPIIVVSTQVVEVSLNIDLDVLYTDPAPLEALVQRFGRINRLRRVDKAPVYVCVRPDDGQGVYAARLVRRTLAVLAENAHGKDIDEARVESWLDDVYKGDLLSEWEETYRNSQREFRRACLASLSPFKSLREGEEQFERVFDGTEVLPAAFEKTYRDAAEENPFEAANMLVPVSWRWLASHADRLLKSDRPFPPVVDLPYSSEYGLEYPTS